MSDCDETFLVFQTGPSAGMHFELPSGKPFIVGRGSSSDTKLDDAKMSREHCCLTVEWDGAILVRDLGSSGGTFINEGRIDSGTIWKGFEFSAGESTAVILSEEEVGASRDCTSPMA
ncbi:FHA domain-containing protein [bacterium]|jgi:pSer/pThr/pTyr-binding forkhead associated (FHA) protein|nr:FHA domain-containing protein [bacterium]MDB4640657.1 FHA domain-containing protein [Pirellulaceae bacterium]